MNRVRNCALLLSLLLAPMAFTQAAGLYKWTDENGNVHYGQLPPSEHTAQKLSPPVNVPAQPAKEEKQTDKIPEEAKRDAEMLRVKQQNCEVARGNLQTYQDYNSVRQPDGTVVEMSDEMREAKIKEAQEMIDKFCN